MLKLLRAFAASISILILTSLSHGADVPPAWAYPINPPNLRAAPDDGKPKRVPNSTVELTRAQITGRGAPVADWHPEEHPPMPDIVGKPRLVAPNSQLLSCGYCHLPNGAGRPENASLAGLTPGYFKQQVLAFRNGERPGSEPTRAPQTNMIAIVKAMNDAEIDQAAAYFAAIKPASFMKVIEADTVPKTTVAGWMLTKAPDGGTEPIGNRIIEIADDFERFEHRDSRTPYTVYVPRGSLKKGADLVNTPAPSKTLQCAICHGPEFKGLADIPRLAGRSPSYLMRQLYDIKAGTRNSAQTVLMKAVVANLTEDDMLAVSAYLASREP
ncbi:MAG: c-type cytochrome [Opitutaceae bacterium]